ncbi:hypothetical protein PORY_002740 [Pneumocystis oryctolagi]|uniref:Uncharacterized protein n=1 Tax=Pneumocystis oryctolagi TaxID=42067 RepID=A0ACB7CBJ8_9ASCO|nr:hypothetical protein PORY_002740 [Pneumocystis oryctolagi]
MIKSCKKYIISKQKYQVHFSTWSLVCKNVLDKQGLFQKKKIEENSNNEDEKVNLKLNSENIQISDVFNEFVNKAALNSSSSINNSIYHFHAFCSNNNTIITLTNFYYNPVICITSGMLGFKKSQRGGYEAGYQVCMSMFERMTQKNIRPIQLEIILRGFGKGREAIFKCIAGTEGAPFRPFISRITDATRLKFGGDAFVIMYTKNEKQNEYYVQQAPFLYRNFAHNHQYNSFSKGNNIISIDELTELNVNPSVDVIDHNSTTLDFQSDPYTNSYCPSKAVCDRQFFSYQNPNFLYTDNFHSVDAPPIMTQDSKAFHSMSVPVTANDYCFSRDYSADSFSSFFDSSFPGYSLYKKKDMCLPFVKESLASSSIFDDKKLLEKHKKRRESHNAVERRRRDNINEKIQELANLVSENLFSNKIGSSVNAKNVNCSDSKLNKGEILRKSVDYIRNLQNYINELNTRSQWLESEVIRLGGNVNTVIKANSLSDTLSNIDNAQSPSYGNDDIDEVKIWIINYFYSVKLYILLKFTVIVLYY